MYTKKVMNYFLEQKHLGKLKDADAVGKVGNVVCGDILKVYIKVGKNKKGEEIIKDMKVETTGCVAALASSSASVELAKGKTLEQAKKIKKEDIVKKLKGMPPIKIHCSVLGINALKKAIENYENKKYLIKKKKNKIIN